MLTICLVTQKSEVEKMKKVMIAYMKDGKWFYKLSKNCGKTFSEEKELEVKRK
jgi:hypothetical protein